MPPFTISEKWILGASAAAAVLCLLPWYGVSFDAEAGRGLELNPITGGANANAFDSAFGVIAFLAILAAIGLLFADRAGALPWPRDKRLLAPFAAIVVAFACTLLFITQTDDVEMMGISAGRTFWFWLTLVAIGIAGFHAWQRWTQHGSTTSTEPEPQKPAGE